MRPEFEKYSLIDNYLSGKLTEQESSAFEKSMAEDPALREDVFDRKVVNEIIIENRFFDIAAGLRTPASITQRIFSKSVKRFVGIGAAITVILFTPYYFSKRSEQTVETSVSADQTALSSETTASSEESSPKEIVLEEQLQETNPADLVDSVSTPSEQSTEAIKAETSTKEKTTVASTKKKAKSYILEIPIDDPSAKHSSNSYAFNPSKNQSWKVPMGNYKQANLTIFNKEGDEVYSASIETGKNNRWNGLSAAGMKQKAGKYTYLLDFGNGKIEHGHVTINP